MRTDKNTTLLISALFSFIVTLNGCGKQIKFPVSLMEMNKPEYLLRDSLFWNKNESPHFIYYSSKKVDSDLIPAIIENQEININRIADIMGIDSIEDYENKAIVCGAFIKYLITTFGSQHFISLWKNIGEDDAIFNTIYNKNLSDLENDFYSFLAMKN